MTRFSRRPTCFVKVVSPTRMDDIARAANLSKVGIWSGKEVFGCLVNEEYVRSMDTIRAVRAGPGRCNQKLGALAQHYLEIFWFGARCAAASSS